MTIEQANSELIQIYGALAPNKQIAIDTLIKASIKLQERDSTTKASITMMRLDYEARLKADIVAVLDRVRVEIEELYSCVEFDEDLKTSFNMVRLEEVQRVIEKYKAGSKDEEE